MNDLGARLCSLERVGCEPVFEILGALVIDHLQNAVAFELLKLIFQNLVGQLLAHKKFKILV